MRHGPATLEDAELLSIMLRTGAAGVPVLTLAHQLLARFGSLRALLAAEHQHLQDTPGLGPAKSSQLIATLELARRASEEPLRRTPVMDQPALVKRYCAAMLAHHTTEHCIALYLDNQLRLITCRTVAEGTLTQAVVYPRELVRTALAHHASALILAHNHPAGTLAASPADLALTQHLKQALGLVDVRLLDHMIVADGQVLSMAEKGQC